MAVQTYRFDNVVYVLEDEPADGATLSITWGHTWTRFPLWARFVFKRDGSSTVTTASVPRLFNAWTIGYAQRYFAQIIKQGKGVSAFKILQAYFDARKLYQGMRSS
jgi:hypothetical protein